MFQCIAFCLVACLGYAFESPTELKSGKISKTLAKSSSKSCDLFWRKTEKLYADKRSNVTLIWFSCFMTFHIVLKANK